MKVLLSHPTGNANVRAVAMGFLNADILLEFHTTVAAFKGNIFDRVSAFPGLSEFKRRSYDSALEPYVKTWPWYELGRFAASKMGLNNLTHRETGVFGIDGVYRNNDKRIADRLKTASQKIDAIYGYEDGSLSSFRASKTLGLQCLYDLPIGYWRTARKLLDLERERWPDWIPTLNGFEDTEVKLARKDEELLLADRIFVASSFTASTLKDFPGKIVPVEVIPYGFPAVFPDRKYHSVKGRKLKLLFVGGLSQRKGIADLFAAVKALDKYVELTVVGRRSTNNCPALDRALAECTWIPSLPHPEILKIMSEHDVLVFPSLFEGFGLVITEAMSQGTPVITTDRTAGPDLIQHGRNGWLIEAGSTGALQETIEDILNRPEIIEQAGKAALETASKRPWSQYGLELANAVKYGCVEPDKNENIDLKHKLPFQQD